MAIEYKIPLQFKSGRYVLSAIPTSNENTLKLVHGDFGILSYFVPQNSTEVRLYNVIEKSLENLLYAIYNDKGTLKSVELIHHNKTKLVFIDFSNEAEAKVIIGDAAKENAAFISDELIKSEERIARLFVEYNRDDECFSFAAKINTVNDMHEVANRSWNIDKSGNYPNKNRIDGNNDKFSVMLLCSPGEIRSELIDMIINAMIEIIKSRVVNVLNKTDDFKLIVEDLEEYE